MLTKKNERQNSIELVIIDQLVPENHLLRKIDKYIDFSFIYDLVENKYCLNNGRPSIDPVMLFKIMLIGYLYGIRSERRLIDEINVNVAYRWFLGLSLTDKVIDYSTLSQNRRRRFTGTDIFEKIFDRIVFQAIELGFVRGKILYTDSTHLKANANKNKFESKEVETTVKEYIDDLNEAVNEDRINHNKKVFKKKDHEPVMKTIKSSTTDPDSGYMFRDGKPKGFFYLDHRTVDSQNNIITDVHITPGNVNDVAPYLNRLDVQKEKFGFNIKYVGIDAGYYTSAICKGLEDRKIQGAIAYRSGPSIKGKFKKHHFQYIKEWDVYACPESNFLRYKTTSREGYKEYISDKNGCANCSCKEKCLIGENIFKTLRRHVWEESKERVKKFMSTQKGKVIYKRRKETIERSFADSKELHGLRYCHFRGIEKVREQSYLTATAQNIKRIIKLLTQCFYPRIQNKNSNIPKHIKTKMKLSYFLKLVKPTIVKIVGLSLT